MDSLKRIAKDGDLIVRAGDDLLSEQIRHINEIDKTYSHSGIIIWRNNQKMVCHIAPDASPADTIQYVPIDSFINTSKNLKCALYRYTLSPGEIDSMKAKLEIYSQQNIRFDKRYDMATPNSLYCSEMIALCLEYATKNRMSIKLAKIPKRMHKLMMSYFKQENVTSKILLERDIVTIDNLYRRPDCRLLMEFPLKYFPGQ